MTYTDAMKEVNKCLEGWEEGNREDAFVAAYATLEYAQWIEKINFDEAKEIMYRFVERMMHPNWD